MRHASISPITMPKWGIEMTEGTITGWRVQPGDRIERGAEILDVETEKIVNAVESPASGVLKRIVADAGETRSVGSLIGVIADAQVGDAEIGHFIESFVGAVVSFEPTAEPAAHSPQETDPPDAAAPAPARNGDAPGAVGGDEARISPIARRVAERLGVDLSLVVGTGRHGRISKEDVETFAARSATAGAVPGAARLATAAAAPGAASLATAAAAPGAEPAPTATPARTAAPAPTAVPAPAAAPASPATRRVAMSARRATIARRLLQAKQSIPHFRLDVDVDFGALMRARREANADADAAQQATLNDWLLRAVALSLVQHPLVNAQLDGDEIIQFDNADISIAVSAEAGLITPILRSANLKPVAVIARESRELIARARNGTLQREDIDGGSFTVSNLGMYGVRRFDAIINAPQVAILAVGAVGPRAVVQGGALAVAEVATLTLSADHRVVDGAVGAAFLGTLRQFLLEPHTL